MAWALVQSHKATSAASSSAIITIAEAFGSNVTAGNRIILYTSTTASASTDVPTPTDSQGNTYTNVVGGSVISRFQFVSIWTAVAASTGSLTITVKTTAIDPGAELGWSAEEYSGLDASAGTGSVDKTAAGTGNDTNTSNAASGTTAATTAANQLAVSVVGDWGASATWTVNAGGFTKNANASVDANATQGIGVANKTSASGATESCTWTTGGVTDTDVAVVAVFKLAAAATSIPYNPQRAIQTRDLSETPWIQKDRRDANLVATAANPLVSPLDTAWQADGRYWHLYNDTAVRDRRAYFQQRLYVSTPGLLATAELENELLGGADDRRRHQVQAATHVDRREVPQQRIYVSDPNLIAPAGTDPLSLPTGPGARAAAYWDRRQIPQQPQRESDPLLLATAELENELLGGGDTAKRANTPATHAPRWWVPQQPQRKAYSPGLLDSALLENELLGGAGTGQRYLTPATNADRREMPQQRPYVSDPLLLVPPPVPLDPTLAGWAVTWQVYNTAALHADRREVPQQRPYISDPSFYPTVAPTDPLTLAWGADGTYWLIYNTAALFVDRREVPQQRRYISDPGMLATALLENELLGSADNLRRRYGWASFYDRRETTGWQPRWPDPSLLVVPDADPLLVGPGVGGDIWRRYNTTATHYDRRETTAQPSRWQLYFSIDAAISGRLGPFTTGPRMGPVSAAGHSASATIAAALADTSTSAHLGPSTSGGKA